MAVPDERKGPAGLDHLRPNVPVCDFAMGQDAVVSINARLGASHRASADHVRKEEGGQLTAANSIARHHIGAGLAALRGVYSFNPNPLAVNVDCVAINHGSNAHYGLRRACWRGSRRQQRRRN